MRRTSHATPRPYTPPVSPAPIRRIPNAVIRYVPTLEEQRTVHLRHHVLSSRDPSKLGQGQGHVVSGSGRSSVDEQSCVFCTEARHLTEFLRHNDVTADDDDVTDASDVTPATTKRRRREIVVNLTEVTQDGGDVISI